MRILLFSPKWTGTYGVFSHFAKKSSIFTPLNLAYVGAVAERGGHDVKIVDCEAEDITAEQLLDMVWAYEPHLIGTTATTPTFHFAVDYTEKIKEDFNIPTIIGGSHITVLKKEAFNPCFDYGFVGESEESWKQFLDWGDISKIKGILYRDKGDVRFTGEPKPILDIDSVPFPARHLLNMDRYKLGTPRGVRRTTAIMASRGCPFHCIFCTTNVFGDKVRRRSLSSVISEIHHCITMYNTQHFYFFDDTLTLDRKYIIELCKLIEPLGITFEGSTRANLVDEEVISSLKRAGLVRLSFGLETVNPNIRRIIKKEVPLEAYTTANRLTNKYGIETLNSCMIGLPGETKETINETLTFLRHSKEVKQANLAIAVPYPGTELYDMAIKREHGLKLLTDDFSKYWRYGSAVMDVGELTPEDLLQLQNDAFVSIYSAPWRWIPLIKKQGIVGFLLTLFRVFKRRINGK